MKHTRILSALLLIGVLGLSLLPLTGSAASVAFFGADDFVDFDHSPVLAQPYQHDEPSSLSSLNPYWTDLVDTEHVAETGETTYVAVLDTGLLSNWPTLFSQADIAWELGKGFSHDITYDPATGGLDISPVRDDRGFITNLASGHGTHVTSTIVGYNIGGVWINGVAPHTTIIPVLVLDAWEVTIPGYDTIQLSGGTNDMVAAGIMYVADLASDLDGRIIINMSLGGSYSPAIEAALNYAISQDVIIVASAGNNGEEGMGYPGALPQVISAAAAGWTDMFTHDWLSDAPEKLNQQDSLGNNNQIYLEDFSSRPNKKLGQKHQDLDVAAPGAWIVGPYKSAFANNFNFYYLSGTSMAAPHVSAIAALVLETHGDIDQAGMEFILKLAARGMPLSANDAVVAFPFNAEGYYHASWDGGDYGAGFLQADSALSVAAVHA